MTLNMTKTGGGSTCIFPLPRPVGRPLSQPDEYAELRRLNPVVRVTSWNDREPWLLTRYADCKNALTDFETFSNNTRLPGWPSASPALAATIDREHNLRTMDPPEQYSEKAMIQRDLSRRAVDRIRPAMQAYTQSLVDGFDSASPVDLINEYATLIPGMAICEVLGIPYSNREFFATQGGVFLSGESTEVEAARAGQLIDEYLDTLVARKQSEPGDDLISHLLTRNVPAGQLTIDEVKGYARMLLAGGFESTANGIGLAILALLENPAQLTWLRQNLHDGPRLSNAVQELLRFCSPNQTGQRRVVRKDISVAGRHIRKGDGVIIATGAANRDPDIFTNPDELDLQRANADQHLAFGFGPHQCIGQLLARAEMEIALRTLLETWTLVTPLAAARDIETGNELEITFRIRELPVRLSISPNYQSSRGIE